MQTAAKAGRNISEFLLNPGALAPGLLTCRRVFFERAKAMPWWFWVLLVVFVGLLVLLFVLRNKRPED